MDIFEEKMKRQKELEEQKKKEKKYGYGDEWEGKKSPRFKVKHSREDKPFRFTSRFAYDEAEEGD